jgi:hypothetical protein
MTRGTQHSFLSYLNLIHSRLALSRYQDFLQIGERGQAMMRLAMIKQLICDDYELCILKMQQKSNISLDSCLITLSRSMGYL